MGLCDQVGSTEGTEINPADVIKHLHSVASRPYNVTVEVDGKPDYGKHRCSGVGCNRSCL